MASAWGDSWGSVWGDSWGSVSTTPAGTGGIDPKRRTIYKPTGLGGYKKGGLQETLKHAIVEARIEEAQQISAEFVASVKAQLYSPIMSPMDKEIGLLLKKKRLTDEEDAMLLILLAANL